MYPMIEIEQVPSSGFVELFDHTFWPASYTVVDGRMLGVEIVVAKDDRQYTLSVMTWRLYSERVQNENGEGDDYAYVLSADELQPDTLASVRETALHSSDLDSFLVEQLED